MAGQSRPRQQGAESRYENGDVKTELHRHRYYDRALKVSISTSSCAWQSARIRLCAIPSSPDGTGDKVRNVSVAGEASPATEIRVPDVNGRAAGHAASHWL